MNQAHEYGITQYNHGFYKFGPMEQCDTGEWVRWAEVEPFLRAADLRVQTAIEDAKRTQEDAGYWLKQVIVDFGLIVQPGSGMCQVLFVVPVRFFSFGCER